MPFEPELRIYVGLLLRIRVNDIQEGLNKTLNVFKTYKNTKIWLEILNPLFCDVLGESQRSTQGPRSTIRHLNQFNFEASD